MAHGEVVAVPIEEDEAHGAEGGDKAAVPAAEGGGASVDDLMGDDVTVDRCRQ